MRTDDVAVPIRELELAVGGGVVGRVHIMVENADLVGGRHIVVDHHVPVADHREAPDLRGAQPANVDEDVLVGLDGLFHQREVRADWGNHRAAVDVAPQHLGDALGDARGRVVALGGLAAVGRQLGDIGHARQWQPVAVAC